MCRCGRNDDNFFLHCVLVILVFWSEKIQTSCLNEGQKIKYKRFLHNSTWVTFFLQFCVRCFSYKNCKTRLRNYAVSKNSVRFLGNYRYNSGGRSCYTFLFLEILSDKMLFWKLTELPPQQYSWLLAYSQ